IGCERGKPSLPSMRSPSALVCTPANWMPPVVDTGLTPSRPRKKSKCHHERRNSPSVAHCRPTSCCFATTFSISASSISFSAAAVIAPAATFARASLRRAGRRKLPTWSARNGGFVRCICLPPDFVGDLDDQPQLGPLLLFRERVALLGRGEAALAGQAAPVAAPIISRPGRA